MSVGFMGYAAVQSVSMLILNNQRLRQFALFALTCTAIGYQYVTLKYMQTNDVSAMVELLRLQTSWAIVATALMLWNINLHTSPPRPYAVLAVFSVISIGMLLLNHQLPFGIRFSAIDDVRHFTVVGEQFSILNGQPSLWRLLLLTNSLFITAWGLSNCWRVRHQRPAALLPTVIGIFILYLITSYVGHGVDQGELDFIYVAGFAIIPVLLLFSVSLMVKAKKTSQQLSSKSEALEKEKIRRQNQQVRAYQLAQVVYQSPAPLILMDTEGQVLSTNTACKDFWGMSLEHMELNLLDVLRPIYPEQELSVKRIQQAGRLPLSTVANAQLPQQLSANLTANGWLNFELYCSRDIEGSVDLLVAQCTDQTESYFSQKAYEYLAQGVSSQQEQSFFDGMALNLAKLFNAKYAIIGLLQANNQAIQTLSLMVNGHKADNIVYPLDGSPCQQALEQNQVCCYPSDIQRQFPDDQMLQDMAIEGYIGAALVNAKQQPIGIINVFDTKPFSQSHKLNHIMHIFAARAAAEVQRNQAEQKLLAVAYEDYLTRLPNRAQTHEYLSQQLLDPMIADGYLLMMDIDHFKTINDQLGHDVGDDVLRHAADKLREQISDAVFISRQGGDEFIFIAQEQTIAAAELAKQVLSIVRQPFQLGSHMIDLAGSVGIVSLSKELTALDVIRRAEMALYQAKHAGRGCYSYYQQALEQQTNHKNTIRQALKQAIANNQLSLVYQPQIGSDDRLYGAEALVRWHDDELGFVSPAEFIPIAEESGLIHQLGDWVIQKSLSDLIIWQQLGMRVGHLSINVSPWQFALSGFADRLIELVQVKGLQAKHICIELTESSLLTDLKETIAKLNKLRAYGFRVALDDFGTGYSSLAYLRDLPIDILKIDKAFIDELEQYQSSPLTESMIAIGQHMSLDVVAEGVESANQVEKLKALGCDVYQGYYFSKPLTEQQFRVWLSHHNQQQEGIDSRPT
ncbi:bifunctional diguanylate cyclase/phosphodiesterase [Neiella sp. HB171785]|uniref:Bifunctional diguanylate cyclase/phosphodiesterase n=2 Tax=Neiella litorisoli TaxID=2771431 RepID=A0A8J6R1Z2_9GAMM|nr:bifunctional diguanylate cyclase/phosphodiesterase [Neiella litorisoli]